MIFKYAIVYLEIFSGEVCANRGTCAHFPVVKAMPVPYFPGKVIGLRGSVISLFFVGISFEDFYAFLQQRPFGGGEGPCNEAVADISHCLC